MQNQKTAILLGATGLTGSLLLEKLLKDSRYSKIKIFTRRSSEVKHDKIEEYIIDLFRLEEMSGLFTGDEVFCCIGTTQSKTPDEDLYRQVDFGIPATAAKLCKKNEIETFVVVSALGADENSRFFYNRTKGEMENAVLEEKIKNTYILQPSLIGGKRKESRPFEMLWKKIMKVGNHLLVGRLKKYRSIHPDTIAEAMLLLANNGYKRSRIESEEIKELVNQYHD